MRGDDDQQEGIFSYISPEKRFETTRRRSSSKQLAVSRRDMAV